MLKSFQGLYWLLLLVILLTGCATTIPKEALQLSPESLQQRQIQTRRFDTKDESALLSASAAVIQDLGFIIDESETDLGVIVASKDRSAIEAGQIAASILYAAFFGTALPYDTKQKLRASLITRPIGERKDSILVRITFQRIVWNDQGQISRNESLDDPKFYQDFFQRLSKAVFLDAHDL